jgi:hypothetical protein
MKGFRAEAQGRYALADFDARVARLSVARR